LFSINLPSYPELIKEFYVKMLVNFDGEIELKVKNKNFDLSFDLLDSILEIPYDGTRAWNQKGWPVSENFNREKCVRLLFGENTQVVQKMYSRNLSLHYRFLHRVVATHILPKAGGFDEVTHMEAFTMFHIITGRKICVPQLIMKHMLAIHDRENARLPYSNIITKILMYFEVDLSGELYHSIQSTDRLGKGTLGRMGFKKHKRLGTWILREEDSNRIIEEEGEELGENAQAEATHEPEDDSPRNVNMLSTQFEALLDAIKGIQQEVKDIKLNVQTIKRRQKRMARRLVAKGMVGDESLITSSSDEPEATQREDEGATDKLGDLDGNNDDEDTPMAD
ncbi:hypothetical protein CFOL_v3_31318, partial [Cephalotus follicularis]